MSFTPSSLLMQIETLQADLSTTRQQLLAAQVDHGASRALLKECLEVADNWPGIAYSIALSERVEKFIATPPDLSALSLHDANERKEGAREALTKAVDWFSIHHGMFTRVPVELRRMLAELDQAPQGEKP